MDALKVVEYDTTVVPANLNLNDTVHFQSTHDIQVINDGDETVVYEISHDAGITVLSRPQGTAWIAINPPYLSEEDDIAKVDISSSSLTLGPGETGNFSVTFTEPSGPTADLLPVYGGSIQVVGDQGEAVRVTYMGK